MIKAKVCPSTPSSTVEPQTTLPTGVDSHFSPSNLGHHTNYTKMRVEVVRAATTVTDLAQYPVRKLSLVCTAWHA